MKNFSKDFQSKEAVVAILGLGYVGLPLLLRFSEVGYPVIGLDIDAEKIAKLRDGESYIRHIPREAIVEARDKGAIFTSDFTAVTKASAVIICVPTPLNQYREPDLSFVVDSTKAILPHLQANQIVSLESTTYPGTTNEVMRPLIESQGFRVGENLFLVYSPEREDPGNKNFSTRSIPKVVSGITSNCLEMGMSLYSQVVDQLVPVSSTRVAEMTKLLENIHRAVNIGLVNELKVVCDRMGIDIYEVIKSAATKPFGFVPYMPGPGLGGHCIPIDPFYLTWKAREYGLHTRFIELAGEINRQMPQWVTHKIAWALNERGKPLRGSRILVIGLAYKKNVDDSRESPAVEVMEQLATAGAELSYSDPFLPRFPKMREHNFDLESVTLSQEILPSYDCVVLLTDHDCLDYDLISKHSKLIVDSRGRFDRHHENVVRA